MKLSNKIFISARQEYGVPGKFGGWHYCINVLGHRRSIISYGEPYVSERAAVKAGKTLVKKIIKEGVLL